MKWLVLILFMCSLNAFAQYPFEKYPAIKYIKVPFKIVDRNEEYENICIADYKQYRLKFFRKPLKDSNNFLLYYKNKLIKKIALGKVISPYLIDTLYVADIDGNGKIDFKITFWNFWATGLASSIENKVFLFNRGNNHFSEIYFADFFQGKEYGFNNDNSYKIIGKSLITYKNHSYWLFDIYDYDNGKLINISKTYGYPIAISYLKKETFIPTTKIPEKQLDKLSLKYPEFYINN